MAQTTNSIIKQQKALSIFGAYLREFGRKKLEGSKHNLGWAITTLDFNKNKLIR
jgi:hypothetical protein